jgi:hypothetical protein
MNPDLTIRAAHRLAGACGFVILSPFLIPYKSLFSITRSNTTKIFLFSVTITLLLVLVRNRIQSDIPGVASADVDLELDDGDDSQHQQTQYSTHAYLFDDSHTDRYRDTDAAGGLLKDVKTTSSSSISSSGSIPNSWNRHEDDGVNIGSASGSSSANEASSKPSTGTSTGAGGPKNKEKPMNKEKPIMGKLSTTRKSIPANSPAPPPPPLDK